MSEKVVGNLIIIGGAEDKVGDKEILKKVVSYINKEKDMILIATIATEYPEKSFKNYEKAFKSLGVKNIEKLDIKCRADAYVDENIKLAVSNNNLICCGEGICGACSIDLNGVKVKTCKTQVNSREYLKSI